MEIERKRHGTLRGGKAVAAGAEIQLRSRRINDWPMDNLTFRTPVNILYSAPSFTMQKVIHGQLCFLRTACVLAALIAGAAAHAADITFETRALTGTDGPLGPKLGAGVYFSGFSTDLQFGGPVLDDAGQTAFRGFVAGPGVDSSNNEGIWSEGGGSGLTLVARAGNPAPGTAAGVNFSGFFSEPVLNGAGQTAFRGFLNGPGVDSSNYEGIWSKGGGSGLALVARAGYPAPGTTAGVNFGSPGFGVFTFNPPVLNSAGQAAFYGTLIGSGVTSANDTGIWSEGSGSGVALVARRGDQAPGMATGVYMDRFYQLVLNGAGRAAFKSELTGPALDVSKNEGIWSEGGGSGLTLVALRGSQAPGTAAGVNFSQLSFLTLNGLGQIAFYGHLDGLGVRSTNNTGIWSEGGGSGLALVARKGDPAPGTPAGVNFKGFNVGVMLNSAGKTAFIGSLIGTGVTSLNDRGIWSEGGGSGQALIARTGSRAPGTTAGVNFSGFGFVALNGVGQIAFVGALTGAGVTSSKDEGIWATGYNGLLRLVVRKGDLLDVSNNPLSLDLRTISSLKMFYGSLDEDGRGTSFNDRGQLAFRASFTDGSAGNFVATIPNSFTVTILIPPIAPATGFDFAWESRPGKVYDLVTSTDFATPVAQWPVHAGFGDIPATGTTTTLTAVPVTGPQRFFAVIEKDAPPAN